MIWIFTIIMIILLAWGLYYLVFGAASIWPQRHRKAYTTQYHNIVVFMPVIEEGTKAEDTIKRACIQSYPAANFRIYVVAGALHLSTLQRLGNYPVEILQVDSHGYSLTEAFAAAVSCIDETYDVALTLQPGDLVGFEFLERINRHFNRGYRALQARLTVKPQPNDWYQRLAYTLDNNIFGKGHHNLGLSASIKGSGMAVEFNWLKTNLGAMDSRLSYEQSLERLLLEKEIWVHYVEDLSIITERPAGEERIKTGYNPGRNLLRFLGQLFNVLNAGNLESLDKMLQRAMFPKSLTILLLAAMPVALKASAMPLALWYLYIAALAATAIGWLLALVPHPGLRTLYRKQTPTPPSSTSLPSTSDKMEFSLYRS